MCSACGRDTSRARIAAVGVTFIAGTTSSSFILCHQCRTRARPRTRAVGAFAPGIRRRLARVVGSARIIWFSMLVLGLPQLLVPLAEPGWRVAAFPVGFAAFSFSAVVYNVAQVSYRQAICPPRLLGRMNAAVRWVVWGTLPLGGLLGGACGALLGVRTTLWIAFVGFWAAGWWVFFSPLRRMRDLLEVHRAPGSEIPGQSGGELPDGAGASLSH
jgi:hypothetical protein